MSPDVVVTFPAALASGAHQAGEESVFLVYRVARALDPRGSSRTQLAAVDRVCSSLFSRKQYRRILDDPRGRRYWTMEGEHLVLRAEAAILRSFVPEYEILNSRAALSFPVTLLNNRQRRGAAVLAAVLAGTTLVSNAFISRFTKVDRGTISGWQTDPTIRDHILARTPEFALSEGDRIRLPNSYTANAETARSSFLLGKGLRSLRCDEGTEAPKRRYFESPVELAKAIRRWQAAGLDVAAQVRGLGAVYVRAFNGWQQLQPRDVLALAGTSPQPLDTSHHHDRDYPRAPG